MGAMYAVTTLRIALDAKAGAYFLTDANALCAHIFIEISVCYPVGPALYIFAKAGLSIPIAAFNIGVQ